MAAPRRTWSIRRPLVVGLATVITLLSAFGVWASVTRIAGAVIGTGVIEVQTTRTAVQHPIGGVVAEVLKQDGDPVAAGELILRLDDRVLRADLAVTEAGLWEVLAGIARAEAALEGRATLALPPLLAQAVAGNADLPAMIDRQQAQLDDHFAAIDTALRLLDEQAAQTAAQIAGIEAQLAAKQEEIALLLADIATARTLADQGLIRAAELSALERERITAEGVAGQLTAQIAELRGRIAETQLKRLAVHTDAAAQIAPELARLSAERTRLMGERDLLLAQLDQLEIRAPVAGRIIEMNLFGARSVVVAASPLAMIVPRDDPVRARLRVAATDIDQLFPGQQASVRFQAFNGRQMPIILGTVSQISADAFLDARTQHSYYEVVVSLNDSNLAPLGGQPLIPGMPVEAFFATESRTPLNYILRPILLYVDRAFRDG
jgi:HlyD family secretion protein